MLMVVVAQHHARRPTQTRGVDETPQSPHSHYHTNCDEWLPRLNFYLPPPHRHAASTIDAQTPPLSVPTTQTNNKHGGDKVGVGVDGVRREENNHEACKRKRWCEICCKQRLCKPREWQCRRRRKTRRGLGAGDGAITIDTADNANREVVGKTQDKRGNGETSEPKACSASRAHCSETRHRRGVSGK